MPAKIGYKYVVEWATLYQSGLTTWGIAEKYNVSQNTVYEWIRDIVTMRRKGARPDELHPRWKGSEVGNRSLHVWVRKKLPKPDLCQECKINVPYDLANISPKYSSKTYTRELKNWEWLCHKCHMIKDGRAKRLGELSTARQRAITHCPLGHVYGGVNLYINPKGHRLCRTCKKIHQTRYLLSKNIS